MELEMCIPSGGLLDTKPSCRLGDRLSCPRYGTKLSDAMRAEVLGVCALEVQHSPLIVSDN